MRFNDEHLVDRSTLSKDEARAFVTFLKAEYERHLDEEQRASREALSQDLLGQPVLALFWDSAAWRHQDDLTWCRYIIAEVITASALARKNGRANGVVSGRHLKATMLAWDT